MLASQALRKGNRGRDGGTVRSRWMRIRLRMVWAGLVIVAAITIAKLINLQAIEGGQQALLSDANHLELIREQAARGRLLDRRGVELPKNKATAPITGYLAEVSEEELGCVAGLCYSMGAQIGRTGLEQRLESTLRGRDGGRLIEVNASGAEVRELGQNMSEPGTDVVLTVDARLQDIMYRSLGERAGSAVALDMQGRVLGLVSSPSYDPNRVVDYLDDTEKLYFLNRAISATYPPGSVFKLVTALAGLTEEKIGEKQEFEDTGEIRIGEYRYGNWYFDQYGKTEGSINVVRALARSNDVFFYKVGEELGVTKLVKWARKMGMGEVTGVELPGEKAGLVPDELWKERTLGEKWFLGNTYHLAIGQGDLLVTPIQVARMTLAAVSGRVCTTSLLTKSEIKCENVGLKTEDLEVVREGMRQACSAGGTAFPLFELVPRVICKTGTAQHGGQKTAEDKPHAWITVAYPAENPEMILTVMLESAGEGSYEAGPVAKRILEEWGAGRGD